MSYWKSLTPSERKNHLAKMQAGRKKAHKQRVAAGDDITSIKRQWNALSPAQKREIKNYMKSLGEPTTIKGGFFKKVGRFLGKVGKPLVEKVVFPIARDVATKYIEKKISGKGVRGSKILHGGCNACISGGCNICGSGLRLAGGNYQGRNGGISDMIVL